MGRPASRERSPVVKASAPSRMLPSNATTNPAACSSTPARASAAWCSSGETRRCRLPAAALHGPFRGADRGLMLLDAACAMAEPPSRSPTAYQPPCGPTGSRSSTTAAQSKSEPTASCLRDVVGTSTCTPSGQARRDTPRQQPGPARPPTVVWLPLRYLPNETGLLTGTTAVVNHGARKGSTNLSSRLWTIVPTTLGSEGLHMVESRFTSATPGGSSLRTGRSARIRHHWSTCAIHGRTRPRWPARAFHEYSGSSRRSRTLRI